MPQLSEISEREAKALQTFERNHAWAKPGMDYQTKLSPAEEKEFLQWVKKNKIPFDPKDPFSDYDMRGYYRELRAGGKGASYDPSRMHFTDKYKTPFHESFSRESQYAQPDKAPYWQELPGGGNRLVTPQGVTVFSEDARGNPIPLGK